MKRRVKKLGLNWFGLDMLGKCTTNGHVGGISIGIVTCAIALSRRYGGRYRNFEMDDVPFSVDEQSKDECDERGGEGMKIIRLDSEIKFRRECHD